MKHTPLKSRNLQTDLSVLALCTATHGTDRVTRMMARWWEGRSLAEMASEFAVSRTRVRAILRRVGCTEALRSPHRRRADSTRKAPQPQVLRARAVLSHPLFNRLTSRQLAAVAWTAQGLNSRDAAWRMGVAPQRVRALLVASQRRLERRCRRHSSADADRPEPSDLPPLTWDGLIESITDAAVTDVAPVSIPESH